MKSKIIALALVIAVIPSVANARGYRVPRITTHHTSRLSSVGQYHLTYHRTQKIKCSYSGCRSDYKP